MPRYRSDADQMRASARSADVPRSGAHPLPESATTKGGGHQAGNPTPRLCRRPAPPGGRCGRVSVLLKVVFVSIGSPKPPAQITAREEFHASLARSVRLLRAFRAEQDDTAAYYALLADDTVRQLGQYTDLNGRLVLDIGGGPGFFVQAFRRRGRPRVLCGRGRGRAGRIWQPGAWQRARQRARPSGRVAAS